MTTRMLSLLIAALMAGCFASAPSTGPECDESQGKSCPAGQACVQFQCLSVCIGVMDCAANEACIDGVCQAYSAACGGGETCADGWYCDGAACRRDVTLGRACNDDSECGQGHCTDHVCCSATCAGECLGCLESLTGRPDGECAPIPAGQDPNN